MKKRRGRLRRIFAALVALTVAVLVAGYAIIASLDVQQVADFARTEVKAATGRDLAIDGPVALRVSLVPSIDLQDVRFANAPWGSRPDMVTFRRLEIEVELLPLLFGEVVVTRLVAVAPDILLETDAEGRGNWEFEEAAAEAPDEQAPEPAGEAGAVSLPDVQDFRIEGGQLTMTEAGSGETLSLEVTEAVGAVPAGGGARSLRLVGAYNGNPFTLEGSYPGLPALLSGAEGPLDMTLAAGGVTLAVTGRAGDLTGDMTAEVAVTAEGESLAGLSPFVGAELPALGPFKLSSDVKAANQTIEFDGLRLTVGGSDLGGNATLDLAAARPALKAALLSKLLDLGDFSGGEGAAPGSAGGGSAGGGSAGGGDRIFSETPLPLEGLRALDAEVKLDAELLRLSPGLELNEVKLTLVLKGGALTVEPLAALLAGGTLDGRLALDGAKAEPDLALALTGRDIDFGELLKRAEVNEGVGGKLELDVDLKGRGASPHAIAAGLDGYVQAVSEDGTIDNAMLSVLSAGLSDITGPLFGQSNQTRLECFVTRFDVAQGQARSRALVLDSGAFAVAGRGGIDLDAERVNLAFDTETSEPSLASLAVPFKVTGPLNNPSFVPDPIGAVAGAVGTVGDVAESGGNIVGGAVDSVGGLIGTGPLIGQSGGATASLCSEALAAIGRGGEAGTAPESGQSSSSSGGIIDDAGKALKDVGEGIEEGLKSLFGN
ncbi:AsmA family protein [Pelagibius marinus]|uniref:AsmA family protein n=1 Tax=Pelagibius marinus TaxID=2762760 RepID=UPI001872505C|nr:AsmA family protein [Pelagibius marinus]